MMCLSRRREKVFIQVGCGRCNKPCGICDLGQKRTPLLIENAGIVMKVKFQTSFV